MTNNKREHDTPFDFGLETQILPFPLLPFLLTRLIPWRTHPLAFSRESPLGLAFLCVRQVALNILRGGVELRNHKLFPQLKFYSS